MLSHKTRGRVSWGAAAQGLAGHRSVGGEQLFSFAALFFLGFYLSVFVIFLFITFFLLLILFYFNY